MLLLITAPQALSNHDLAINGPQKDRIFTPPRGNRKEMAQRQNERARNSASKPHQARTHRQPNPVRNSRTAKPQRSEINRIPNAPTTPARPRSRGSGADPRKTESYPRIEIEQTPERTNKNGGEGRKERGGSGVRAREREKKKKKPHLYYSRGP